VYAAGVWSFAGYGWSQVVRFGSNLVLTRLLVPELFGIVAIANLVLICLTMFSDIGLNVSVIQSHRGKEPIYLNTIWVTQIIRALVLWLLAVAVAFFILAADRFGLVPKESVYANPSLPYVIAVAAVAAFFSGLRSTKVYEAGRELALGRVTQIEIISQLANILLIFLWVAFDRSVWALVAGSVFSSFLAMVLTHIWLPGHPNHWQWDKAAFRQILSFGKWIFLSSAMGFLAFNGDRLVLGGLIGATLFGVYIIAFAIVSSVDQVLARIISSVAYPALSETARDRPEKLKENYYRFYIIIASTAYFFTGFLMISGHNLIRLLYDQRYDDAGWMLQILAVALLTVPLRLASQCFLIFNAPHTYSYIHAFRLVALYGSIPVGFHFFGLPGGLVAVVFASFATVPIIIVYAVKFGLFDWRKELLLLTVVLPGAVGGVLFKLIVDPVRMHAFLHLLVALIK
jgi:O-antigen/teichoic acid export membrane protein